MSVDPSEALRAWFLGPRGENSELLERLIVEALRDHVFWRRNYHPEDGLTIRETDKRREGYEQSVAVLTQELMGLLAQLKQDVPFFSGRYKGHMVAEQTIAAQIGYFATMLYNPNNIAAEISPVTTRLELEVAGDLARMIGYNQARSWGHLTSGGTIANFEALWLARSVRYLPVAAAGAAMELGLALPVQTARGSTVAVADLPLWDLLNVPGEASLDLWERLWSSAPPADVKRAVANHSLAAIGYQEYSRLPVPDINIVCYVVLHPSLDSLESLNAFNERVYIQMSLARPDGAPEYIITRTRLHSPMYDGAIDPVLAAIGICSVEEWKAIGEAGLVVLRSTVMDPFLVAPPPAPDHVAGYVAALRRACNAALS